MARPSNHPEKFGKDALDLVASRTAPFASPAYGHDEQTISHVVTQVTAGPCWLVNVPCVWVGLSLVIGSPLVKTMRSGKRNCASVAVPVNSACGSETPHPATS